MLRIKVEVVPHGIESAAFELDTIWIENDGTGISGGPNDGGVGNYNVFPPGETLGHLHVVDYPSMYACGHIEGVPRDERHRLVVAETALSIVNEWNAKVAAAEAEEDFDPARSNPPEKIERVVNKVCRASESGVCLDPGGYCTNGDCLAEK
jgi:hypothetical protein